MELYALSWLSACTDSLDLDASSNMINASGQVVIDENIPFSDVAGASYQTNAYNWERLLVDSGRLQVVRSIKEPREIATAATVIRIAKAVLDEISPEDDIPF